MQGFPDGATRSVLQNDGDDIQLRAEQLQDIQKLETDLADLPNERRDTPRKARLDSLPEAERPQQLAPLGKMQIDTVKMIAYRAETARVGLLRPHLANEAEARFSGEIRTPDLWVLPESHTFESMRLWSPQKMDRTSPFLQDTVSLLHVCFGMLSGDAQGGD